MTLIINDDYRIVSDDSNYILQERRIIKDEKSKRYGETDWNVIGYYGNLQWLYNDCINKEIRKDDLNGLQAILDAIDRIGQDIKESLSKASIDTNKGI